MSKAAKLIGFGIALFMTGGMAAFAAGGKFMVAAGTMLKSAGVNMILGGMSKALSKKPRETEAAIKASYIGGTNHQQVVFGEVQTGGQLATFGSQASDNSIVHLAVAHSLAQGCGVESITDVYLDDKVIPTADINGSGEVTDGAFAGLVNIRRYLGTSTQAADATLVSALSSKSIWNSNAHGKGVAYTAFEFRRAANQAAQSAAFPRGVPSTKVIIRGQKCYDPRLDSTNGGSGSHRLNDSATWAWTRNSALCVSQYHIMSETDGGAGFLTSEIHWASVAVAANVCDTVIAAPGGDIPRFTTNVALSTASGVDANIEILLSAMGGRTVYTWGGIKVYAASYQAPTATIDASWLTDEAVTYTTSTPIGQLVNTVKPMYESVAQGYKMIAAQAYTDAAWVTEDKNQRLSTDLPLPATDNEYRAQYLGQIFAKRGRLQKKMVVPVNMKGLDIEAWQTIEVNIPDLDITDAMVWRVVNWEFTGTSINLELAEETAAMYTLSTLATITAVAKPAATTDGVTVPWTGEVTNEITSAVAVSGTRGRAFSTFIS